MSNVNTYYGIWDPIENPALPIPQDLDFAAYYILNNAEIGGTNYTKDTWLIYFCEGRNTPNERSSWVMSNGLLCFNKDSSYNTPDPGWYTKVRLDNNGNVVMGEVLSEEDLPKELTSKFEVLSEDNISRIINNIISKSFSNETNNPIKVNWDNKTSKLIADLQLDETTIGINEFGQLSVIGFDDLLGNSGTGDCANHTHTANQIEGLEQFVKDVLTNYKIKATMQDVLAELVDEETIIVNSSGRLSAIAMKVGIHSHVMNDISDLNQKIANVWASNQTLHKYKDEQDFDDGILKMDGLVIGDILINFNKYFREYFRKLNEIESRIGTIEPIAPDLIDVAKFKITSPLIEIYDIVTEKNVLAMQELEISTDSMIYVDGSRLYAYIDANEVDNLECYNNGSVLFAPKKERSWTITYVGEAYPEIKAYQGFFKGFKFKFNYKDLSEGPHTIQFKTINVNTGIETWSQSYDFIICKVIKAISNLNNVEALITNKFISGVRFIENIHLKFEPIATVYTTRYAPVYNSIVYDCLGNNYPLKIEKYSNGDVYYMPIELDVPKDYLGIFKIYMKSYSILNTEGPETEYKTIFIAKNTSNYESYRVSFASLNSNEINNGIYKLYEFKDWNSIQDLTDPNFLEESVFIDDYTDTSNINWSNESLGPDYSIKDLSQEFTLKFKINKPINNFYFDLLDKDNNEFEWDNLHKIENDIYAAISLNNNVDKWIDCNAPYIGFGNWNNSVLYPGLDLFRTTKKRKWITLGKDPINNNGYLYLHIKFKGSINIKALVESIEESLANY